MDWIEAFLAYTEGIPTADIYRLWTAITILSGAMERRVWTQTRKGVILYPNLFTLLVGSPGTGKTQSINPGAELWHLVKDLNIAPDNMTRASLLDALEKSSRKILHNNKLVEFHSMLIAADEFGVLCPAHDLEFLSVMNKIFDNPPRYIEERRHNKKLTEILAPHITLLAGTQPGFMANLLPEEAWSMGFTSRLIMIYSAEKIVMKMHLSVEEEEDVLYIDQKKWLVSRLAEMTGLHGRFVWEPKASALFDRWNETGQQPKPEHSKLEHYTARRGIHVLKLSMVSSISRGNSLIVTEFDVGRAMVWMFAAEDRMPDIFREMVNRSDAQVIDELFFFLWKSWAKNRRPIPGATLRNFLTTRIHSDKIDRLIDMCVKANILAKTLNIDTYTPRPRSEHGLE